MWARGSAGILAGIGVALFAGLFVALYFSNWVGLVVVVVLLGFWAFLLLFFRDPERHPLGDGVVSAADGRVRAVDREGELWRISVFMNVTNVHVNRFPLEARVAAVSDAGKGYRPAYRPDAQHNRQRAYALETALGPVEVVQMTGVVARRLVSFVAAGERHARGERLGMIVLGSRVDVLLAAERCQPTVIVGDVVRAGATVIAVPRPP